MVSSGMPGPDSHHACHHFPGKRSGGRALAPLRSGPRVLPLREPPGSGSRTARPVWADAQFNCTRHLCSVAFQTPHHSLPI